MYLDNNIYLHEKKILQEILEEVLNKVYNEYEGRGLINSGSLIRRVSAELKSHLRKLGTEFNKFYDITKLPPAVVENEIENEIRLFIKRSPGSVVPKEFYTNFPNYRSERFEEWKIEAEKMKFDQKETEQKQSIGILNRGSNNTYIGNTFEGMNIGIKDEGKRTWAQKNKFITNNPSKNDWSETVWGRILIGVVVAIFAGLILYWLIGS